MYRILFILFIICFVQIQSTTSERRFSPFRSAFRISSGQASARNNDDDLTESHATLLPSATRSKPLQTTPFNMATTKKKIISTLLEMTENEISKKLSQFDSSIENNEILSSNNKRFTNEPSTTLVTVRSDSATSSLFELSTEASVKQTTTSASTTSKPRKTIKITTSSSQDALAAAEAAAAMIANMHSMHFGGSNKNINRVSNTATSKIPVHHHNAYGSDFNHDKINFDVNYRPTEAPPAQQASSAPAKKSKDKNRESVKNLLNGLVNFVSSPLFNQTKPLIVSSFSTVSNALSANKNAIGSLSSSGSSSSASSSAGSANSLNSGVISKMFNSLRTFAVLRRNEATTNASKNSKKKGKLNSAVNNQSSNNNNLSNQSLMINFLDSLIKTREALLSMNLLQAPNKQTKPVNKLGSSHSNKNSALKPTNYSNYLNLFRILWKSPTLKQEARSI